MGIEPTFFHVSPAVQQPGWTGPSLELFSFIFWLSTHPWFLAEHPPMVTPSAFPLTSHHLPAHFSKLSSSDLFFSTVLSLFDLLLFKLYTVMFYTIIDNKIAPEPWWTVLFFFSFLEHNLKMTNASWFVSEKWNSSPVEGWSTCTASSLAKERFPEL